MGTVSRSRAWKDPPRKWPHRHPLRVRFGRIVSPAELLEGDGPRGADDAETVVLRLRERVIALSTDAPSAP